MVTLITLFYSVFVFSQVKVSGVVVDQDNETIPFANVIFAGSVIGTVSDEDGKFYLESDTNYKAIEISFVGYKTKTLEVKPRDFDLKIILEEEVDAIKDVIIFSGKLKKKGNPAIALLKKIWAKKRQNGVYLFDQYQYEKYEKLEFDLNNIDSTFKKGKLFKGMEFVFDNVDTSRITGKSFLPIFINESMYNVYGNNKGVKKIREDLIANTNSGFGSNQNVISFVKDLYVDYDIYANYIKIFDKSFVSPLSKTGVSTYNYALADSAFIDNKWCYNIIYYPRRKSELTFKGDFWVNDTTYAIKNINMQSNKSANINWVKDLYIEQSYDVLNDSVFLLKRDYIMSDFSFRKKDKAKGVYGKRTTIYNNYVFDKPKENSFYKVESDVYDAAIYNKTKDYWTENRLEKLNKNEIGIYKMLDTLTTVPKFKRMYNLVSILGSGYIEMGHLDFGPIFSTIGTNDVEGIRLRAGGRTYFGPNDLWRLQGYTAYGFKDQQVKYGIAAKWMFDKKNRIIISGGNRRDIEQIGVSLTTTNDILGRSFASSSFFSSGDTGKLTSINLSNFALSAEPKKNLVYKAGVSYRTLKSASPTFNLDYFDGSTLKSTIEQAQLDLSITYTPKRKTLGNGVERKNVNDNYATLFLNYSKGFKGVSNNDFNFQKVQFYYRQPFQIGGFGRLFSTIEVGKTFGDVPLGMLNVIPGNQSYFTIDNTYALLDYYEFVTDQYASLHFEHHFNGRLFSRIPLLRKLNLREIVGFKALYGSISNQNIAMNAPAFSALPFTSLAPNVIAPKDKAYTEFSLGVGNIFKVLRIDFSWRGSYRGVPNANNFTVKGAFGFHF